jgi:hypothetical protein
MAITDPPRTDDPRREVDALIPEARELQRRRWRRRGAIALLSAALIGGGAYALIGGGGGSGADASLAAVALHGPLPAGIAARAADPAGGLAWGIRLVHTTGYTCVQLGRLRGNQLGLIGRDGLAGNNGRFYPMAPSTNYQARCAPNDGAGHAYMTIELGAQPTSGAGGGYTGASVCQTPSEKAGLAHALARIKPRGMRPPPAALTRPTCPTADLRFVQYGLLGPEATSITYRASGVAQSEHTGPDGAYLVVGGPSTQAYCRQFPQGSFCGANGVGPTEIGGGMIETVRYRNAPTCRLDRPSQRLPAWLSSCPQIGYIPAKPRLTDKQVAAPIHVRVIHAKDYCLNDTFRPIRGFGPAPATQLAPYHPCVHPKGNRPGDVIHGTLVIFSWTARQPVTSHRSNYTFFFNEGRCGGQGGSTYGMIKAGERLTRAVILQPRPRCTRTFTGAVGYNPDLGPGGGDYADAEPGQGRSLLVGRVNVPTHSSTTPATQSH